ncbi:MAG TPA: hypothetical protein VIV14_01975 [Gammaproteobacteria bacterium]
MLLGFLLTLPVPLLCWYGGYRAANRVVPGSLSTAQHAIGLAIIVASFYALYTLAAFAPTPEQPADGARATIDWFRIVTFVLPIIGIAFGARGLAQLMLARARPSR